MCVGAQTNLDFLGSSRPKASGQNALINCHNKTPEIKVLFKDYKSTGEKRDGTSAGEWERVEGTVNVEIVR